MRTEQMQRAIEIEREAKALKKQLDTWVLLKIDQASKSEIINVGDPVQYQKGQYHRIEVAIPDAIRRLAFREWRKQLALKFNQHVRELNQLGVTTDLRLIEFSPITGEPR